MRDNPTPAKPAPAKPATGWLNLVVDYGPVLVFFLVYRHYSPSDHNNSVAEVFAVISGTVAFMLAAVVALLGAERPATDEADAARVLLVGRVVGVGFDQRVTLGRVFAEPELAGGFMCHQKRSSPGWRWASGKSRYRPAWKFATSELTP